MDGSMGKMRVREMPNVLILPRSADYSEEVWLEIREKAVSILQTFLLDDIIPTDAISDNDEEEEEENETLFEDEHDNKHGTLRSSTTHQSTDDNSIKKNITQSIASPSQSQTNSPQSEVKRNRSSKKAKKKHQRQKSMHKVNDKESLSLTAPLKEDDTAMSGTDSPDDSTSKRTVGSSVGKKSVEMLKDGCVVSLQARDRGALHVSRQRAQGGGWFLDTMSNVTKRDPAAQFLVVFKSKDTIGLRSFTAGGKLLQINRRMEFVFASHSFDVWESWTFEGSLEECRLVNCRNPSAVLDVRVEILATVGEDDGITRWLE